MLKKELTVSDLIALLSVFAVGLSVLSNAYFYYSLDALWIMSTLSPSVYFVEVFRVLFLVCLLIISAACFEWLYKILLKSLFRKRKIFYKNNEQEIKNLLAKKRKSFIRGYTVFSVLLMNLIFKVLENFGFIFTIQIYIWAFFIFGLSMALVTNHTLDLITKRITLALMVILVTALNAEIKIAYLSEAPTVYFKDNSSRSQQAQLLEAYQDKIIVFRQAITGDDKVITILKIDQVERIVAKDLAN
ncbi:hypothetical protein C9E88_013450 [Acinetobacter cumulans]|uniref:hypothetical protein n=1 Tax=Acinetobacter cumulans TaxID=2136182 RepID=UPI000D124B77|nr:hypothetical protein [Acinetobacter cumulans]QCO22421.1 hypothetical protein C9E88_013450 [Acinetobacter cumulans]